MVELVDTLDLGSSAAMRGGSSPLTRTKRIFRRSSVVEQLTVNQLVVGSTPTVGAKKKEANVRTIIFFINTNNCSYVVIAI